MGLLPPEGILPAGCRRIFQMLWANNGDIISRQYAGTVALKVRYFIIICNIFSQVTGIHLIYLCKNSTT